MKVEVAVSQAHVRVLVGRGGAKPSPVPLVTLAIEAGIPPGGAALAVEMTPVQTRELIVKLNAAMVDEGIRTRPLWSQQNKPIRVRLTSPDAGHMMSGWMAPYASPPGAVTWNGRVFVYATAEVEANDSVLVYREAMVHDLGADFWRNPALRA